MINFHDVKLEKTIVHRIGNKSMDEGIELAENVFKGTDNEELNEVLLTYFLTSFKDSIYYCFSHPSSLELNDVYSLAAKVFQSPKSFSKVSKDFAKILYDHSDHPKIKPGELYVTYFSNCIEENESVDAIGIFKSENKQSFLQVDYKKNEFNIDHLIGINTQKLDKGAIILNLNGEDGFRVVLIDNLNSTEAQYWKRDFLGVEPFKDDYNSTKNFLSVTKEFVSQLPEEFEVSKTDQIDLLKRSIDYFKSNDSFEKKDFEKKVFEDKEIIKSFRKFDEDYRQRNSMEADDTFDISAEAVKKQGKIFKNVIKLDKNFHVYVHGNTAFIERGIEPDGRKFYKIYYSEES